MTWVRLDDNYSDHPKQIAVGPLGTAVHVRLLCYSARHLTDGHVPRAIAIRAAADAGGKKMIAAMVKAGILEESGEDFHIHAFDEFQQSREKVLAERERAAKGMKESRERKKLGKVTPPVTPPLQRNMPVSYGDVTPPVTGQLQRPDPTPLDHHHNAQARPLSEQGQRIKAAILRVVGDADPSQIGVVDSMAAAMPTSHEGHDVAGFVEWVVETWTNEGKIATYRERIEQGEGLGIVTQEIARAVANWRGKGYRVPAPAQAKPAGQGRREAGDPYEPKPFKFNKDAVPKPFTIPEVSKTTPDFILRAMGKQAKPDPDDSLDGIDDDV